MSDVYPLPTVGNKIHLVPACKLITRACDSTNNNTEDKTLPGAHKATSHQIAHFTIAQQCLHLYNDRDNNHEEEEDIAFMLVEVEENWCWWLWRTTSGPTGVVIIMAIMQLVKRCQTFPHWGSRLATKAAGRMCVLIWLREYHRQI